MKPFQRYALFLSVPLVAACGLFSQAAAPSSTSAASPTIAPTPLPAAKAASPTASAAGPPADACAPDALRAYLRQYMLPMAGYEFGLIQVYSITNVSNGSASPDKYNAALGMIQSAHDSVAALQAPYCAQTMQADMLGSMEHLTNAIKIRINNGSQAQFNSEMTQAKTDQKNMEEEFGVLSAKAGLNAPPPTP